MAKKQVNQEVEKAIKEIQENIKNIANVSSTIAQSTIIVGSQDKKFTQKHGAELANYIEVKQDNVGNCKIVAGENASDEIRYELLYAEYGAGRNAEEPPFFNPYIPIGAINKYGYWYYRLLRTESYIKNNKIHFRNYKSTNTSIPLHYMKTAREVAKLAMQDLKTTAKHKIKTSIKRGVRNVLEE